MSSLPRNPSPSALALKNAMKLRGDSLFKANFKDPSVSEPKPTLSLRLPDNKRLVPGTVNTQGPSPAALALREALAKTTDLKSLLKKPRDVSPAPEIQEQAPSKPRLSFLDQIKSAAAKKKPLPTPQVAANKTPTAEGKQGFPIADLKKNLGNTKSQLATPSNDKSPGHPPLPFLNQIRNRSPSQPQTPKKSVSISQESQSTTATPTPAPRFDAKTNIAVPPARLPSQETDEKRRKSGIVTRGRVCEPREGPSVSADHEWREVVAEKPAPDPRTLVMPEASANSGGKNGVFNMPILKLKKDGSRVGLNEATPKVVEFKEGSRVSPRREVAKLKGSPRSQAPLIHYRSGNISYAIPSARPSAREKGVIEEERRHPTSEPCILPSQTSSDSPPTYEVEVVENHRDYSSLKETRSRRSLSNKSPTVNKVNSPDWARITIAIPGYRTITDPLEVRRTWRKLFTKINH